MTRSGDIVSRVRQLEHLILSLQSPNSEQSSEPESQQRQSAKIVPTDSSLLDGADEQQQSNAPNAASVQQRKTTPIEEVASITSIGTMLAYPMGTRWVDSSHWQAILDNVGVPSQDSSTPLARRLVKRIAHLMQPKNS